ncbi:MAG: hypothetical protein MUE84_18095 [Hyphomonas sp.]|nr:hypothetical protein [Hyphomonas sp.]
MTISDDDAARLHETQRRRAEGEAEWGRKWDTQDTVALLILSAKLDALNELDREQARQWPQPQGW